MTPIHLDPIHRPRAIAWAKDSARRFVFAEIRYYRLELDARRLGGGRRKFKAVVAQDRARDRFEETIGDILTLDALGISGIARELFEEAKTKIRRGRHALAMGEVYSGRLVPDIPMAFESPILDAWDARLEPSPN